MKIAGWPGIGVMLTAVLTAAIGINTVAQAADTYRISGVVVSSVTRKPLAQTHVVVAPEDGRSKEIELTTGMDGRFVFDHLPAAIWTLSAARKGYLSQNYGQRSLYSTASISVVTGPAGASEGITFPLNPPAAVRGRVTDANGEPVMGAFLEILEAVAGPRTEFVVRKTVATDDRGEYRISDLAPGECYLFAMVPEPEGANGFESQYYPNTADPRAATPIRLKPGEDYTADFTLRPGRGVSVNIEGSSGAEGEVLALLSNGPRGSQVSVGTLGPGSGRTFCHVAPGRYELLAADLKSTFATSRWIDVGSEDVTVTLPFSDPPDVSAKVRVVRGKPGLLKNSLLQIHPLSNALRNLRPLGPDGSTVFPAMAAGSYKVHLTTQELYIESVTARNARVLDGFVDLPESGPVQLEIIAAGDGARVKGKVQDRAGPVSGVLVVLAPARQSRNSDDYHGYTSDSDGSFDFHGIKPGDYKIFACDDDLIEYGNPTAIEKYMASGRAVRAEPNGSVELKLELVKK